MDIDQFITLIQSHAWIPLASFVIGFAVRIVKSDKAVAWFPIAIPPQVRSWLALGLGILAGVLDKVVSGSPWPTALLGGLVAAITAISGHELVVESLRGGRDIGVPKDDGGGGGGGAPKASVKIASLKPDAPAGPYSHMVRHHLTRLVCACLAAVLFVGCINPAQIPQWIQSALVIMQNLASIVNALRSSADLFLMTASPSDDVKQAVEKAFSDVELAEVGVTDLLNAGNDATQLQLDAARDKALAAYSNLTKLLADLGAIKVAPAGTLKATAGAGDDIGVPLLARERIVK